MAHRPLLLPHQPVELCQVEPISVLKVVAALAPVPLCEPLAFPLGGTRLAPGSPRAHSASRRAQPGGGAAREIPLDGALREPNRAAHADRAQRLLVPIHELLLHAKPSGHLVYIQQPSRISRRSPGCLLAQERQ